MFNITTPDASVNKSKSPSSTFGIFHKGTIAIVLVTLILISALIWFGIIIKQRVIGVEKQWHDYNTEAAVASQALHRIEKNFRYDGFIHNFKDYVLRNDASLIPKIKKRLSETRRAINNYPLYGIFQDADDEVYINNLIYVVDQYVVKFELAQRLIKKGVSSNEILRQVQVNDASAFQAINHLSQHAIEHYENYAIETTERLNNVLNFINLGILLVPMVLISGVFMFVLLRQINTSNQSLAESQKFLSDLFEAAPDAMIIVDEEGYITDANKKVIDLFGFSKEKLIGSRVESLMPQRFRNKHIKNRDNAFNKKEVRMLRNDLDIYILDKDNKEIPVEISLSYTVRNNMKNAIVAVRDVTEKKRIEENIKYLAQYDQLTKLPNRSLFNDRFQHAIVRAQRNKNKVCLMFIDLDGFKKVNDTFGHQAGDELLQIVAERLTNVVRIEDTVARLGGDEFTIILEELQHSDDAVVVAKKVLQTIGEAVYLSGQDVTISASVGLSIYPYNGDDTVSLIKNADIAMYKAKEQGKNCYKFFTND